MLPGHKLPFTGLPLRLSQKIDNHHGALDRLRAHLAEPRTAAECFIALFRREIGDGEYGLALAEAVGHLNHLLAWAWRCASGATTAPGCGGWRDRRAICGPADRPADG